MQLQVLPMPAGARGDITPSHQSSLSPITSKSSSTKSVPIPGVSIPNLPVGGWRVAVHQWENVDQTGFALKCWPKAWYTGLMRTVMGTKRKKIAREFIKPSPRSVASNEILERNT